MHHLWATSGSAEIAPEALALTKKCQRVSPQNERAEFAALLPKKRPTGRSGHHRDSHAPARRGVTTALNCLAQKE